MTRSKQEVILELDCLTRYDNKTIFCVFCLARNDNTSFRLNKYKFCEVHWKLFKLLTELENLIN